MSTIINGTTDAITFPDATVQNTSAIVGGKVPYTNLPTGSVLQVVYASYSTVASNSTTTYADTGLTATITPKFSNSKILILVSQNGVYPNTNNTGVGLAILRGTSANICQFSKLEGFGSTTIFSASASYLDSPATISATTYKTQFALGQNTGTVTVQNNGDTSTITLMEIAG